MEVQQLSLDRIETLPQHITEAILCLMPFRDAVSTSILSKDWRYNWAKIPKLVFDTEDMFDWMAITDQVSKPVLDEEDLEWEDSFYVGPRTNHYKRTVYNAINDILFLHEGQINDFTLILHIDNISVEIDQTMNYLSRNNHTTLKKFKLDLGDHHNLYRLPLSIFSFHRLTDLYLKVCDLDFEPIFTGFGCLTSLHLENVRATTTTLLRLLSKSPSLKSFTLIKTEFHIGDDRFLNRDEYSLTDLFECLPVIEHFCVSMSVIGVVFCCCVVPHKLPPSLVHVKHLTLDEVFFPQCIPFALLMIKCSPNLEKLKLQVTIYRKYSYFQSETDDVTYSDISLEHLKELEIEDFANMKSELDFVKFILTKSPMLKKVSICLHPEVDMLEEVMTLRILLHSPRASPMVKIIVECPPKKYKGRTHITDPL
uniref:F-box/FBD/LRR-repeat protein At1g13570-like n=1 Tax=Erigeron canadensis TaxID=72917 RepID=UPI001CB897FB|nr:F-box/FBD/LRR-repeat protein At1g13570-like [Erigeron canadensis]